MALSRLYYTHANVVADDTTIAKRVTTSWLHAIAAFLMQLKTGTNGTSGAPPASALWSMYYSCDGVTAGTANDGVNRIMTANAYDQAKWVRAAAGSAHSWYVLKSGSSICGALPSTPFYLIVDYGTAADTTVNVYLSKAAPTGGTTTARPTATDEVGVTNLVMSDVTVSTHRLMFVVNSVGAFALTYAKSSAGIAHTVMAVQELVTPGLQVGEQFPMVLMCDTLATGRGGGGSAQISGAGGWNNTNGVVSRSPLNNVVPNSGVGNGIMFPANSGFTTATTNHQVNGKTDTIPAQYYFNGTGATGVKGTIPDWYISNSANNVGNCEPSAGATEHMNIGLIWMPNGGVTPTL